MAWHVWAEACCVIRPKDISVCYNKDVLYGHFADVATCFPPFGNKKWAGNMDMQHPSTDHQLIGL